LKIKRILVTQQQPESEKSPFLELAEKNRLQIDFRPFITVEGINSKEFRLSKIDLPEHTAVIFTSKTAIDHFFRICEETRHCVPEMMKYFCTSESIAYYLQKYIVYRKRKIFYGKSTVQDLHDAFVKNKDDKFLLPLSDTHKDDIPNALKAMGVKFTKAILYRTISTNLKECPEIMNYDIMVFYSPSHVKSLFDNFPKFKQNHIKIASFGQSTAKAISDAGLRLDIKAPVPQAPSMTMALEQFIKEHNKGNGKK
jgi:uroporphyrinogen-III synthase